MKFIDTFVINEKSISSSTNKIINDMRHCFASVVSKC